MIKIKLAGIYKITHIPTEQYYIGMSVDIFNRWRGHYTDIKITRHSSPRFMLLWNETDPTEWKWEILEGVSLTAFKIDSGLKGKKLEAGFRQHLLRLEKSWMSKHSKTFALNKNNKHFN